MGREVEINFFFWGNGREEFYIGFYINSVGGFSIIGEDGKFFLYKIYYRYNVEIGYYREEA